MHVEGSPSGGTLLQNPGYTNTAERHVLLAPDERDVAVEERSRAGGFPIGEDLHVLVVGAHAVRLDGVEFERVLLEDGPHARERASHDIEEQMRMLVRP